MSRGIAFGDFDSVDVWFTRMTFCANSRSFPGEPVAPPLGLGPALPRKFLCA
jgi:hypothetical protein